MPYWWWGLQTCSCGRLSTQTWYLARPPVGVEALDWRPAAGRYVMGISKWIGVELGWLVGWLRIIHGGKGAVRYAFFGAPALCPRAARDARPPAVRNRLVCGVVHTFAAAPFCQRTPSASAAPGPRAQRSVPQTATGRICGLPGTAQKDIGLRFARWVFPKELAAAGARPLCGPVERQTARSIASGRSNTTFSSSSAPRKLFSGGSPDMGPAVRWGCLPQGEEGFTPPPPLSKLRKSLTLILLRRL